MDPPRSAFGAPPQGGAAGGPAEPDPRRPLDAAEADDIVVEYFDGRSARGMPARLRFDGAQLVLHAGEDERRYAPHTLRWPERTRHGVRVAELPDGGSLHGTDAAAWDAFARRCGRGDSLVVRAQQSWHWVLASALATLALLAALYVWGVPAAAQAALQVVPPSLDRQIGAGVLAQLDEEILQPTQLPAQRQLRIRAALAQAVAAQPPGSVPEHRLEFRRSKIGPNALALPDGTIVLTDALAELAGDDLDLLTGVLAHELGHLRRRHGMRLLLQAGAVGLLASLVVGDFNSLLAAAPVLLGQAGYSRDAEREADAEAVQVLRAAGISPLALVRFFEKMAQRERSSEAALLGIAIASHPADAERIAFFRAAAQR
ncbi:MAG: M48 family metallopeptidase [Piscinibacter sp.]|uniref:M48 family metallopeptidase n=1 Tax=Piscinibacter sp. TaxID=1903157 RepID=UPI0025865784|nr:M48 family metallopeptidase [Piscinibacter sp.]MCW5665295.1 M48 family metallopeptidase [Piscinibacter sp.]